MEHHEWVQAGLYLGALGRGSQWWIGDWIRYGTKKWGEKYTEAARLTGYDHGSLRNLAWVASQFDVSRRRDNLTWTHHLEVAPLDTAEQDAWLDRATEDKLSASDLRIELRSLRRAREQAAVDGDLSPPVAPEDAGQVMSALPSADGDLHGPSGPAALEHCDGIVCPNCGHTVPLVDLPQAAETLASAAQRSRRVRIPVPAVA